MKCKYLLNNIIKLSKLISLILMHRNFCKNIASLACVCRFVYKTSKLIWGLINLNTTGHFNDRKLVKLIIWKSVYPLKKSSSNLPEFFFKKFF